MNHAGLEPARSTAHPVRANDPSRRAWSVAVFAHNEGPRIIDCLQSLEEAGGRLRITVLANGCSDDTEALVNNYALEHPWVELVSLALGDKANAWNVYLHDVVATPAFAFFVDGDVRVSRGAFAALVSALEASPQANVAAAVPASGRSKQYLNRLVCEEHLVLGNLYALRGEFLRRAREVDLRLPRGYIGDDDLVTSLAKWDLDPTGPLLHERVAPCPPAQFTFESFSPWKLRDWPTYWRRRVRYSLRHMQHELLAPLLRSEGLGAMPVSIEDLYQRQSHLLPQCRPRLGVNALFDRIALRQMRHQVRLPSFSREITTA